MDKPIRVRIMGRDYPLRVREDDEALTREMATYVDTKMQTFKQAHPDQSDLVTAVMTALALTEDLFNLRTKNDQTFETLDTLDQALAEVLEEG